MALIEGMDFGGARRELTIVTYQNKGTKESSTFGAHEANKVAEASVEKNTTKVAPAFTRHTPELAVLFGTDDF